VPPTAALSVPIATIFVAILVLDTSLGSAATSIIVGVGPAVLVLIAAIPIAITTLAVTVHPPIPTHRTIITVVATGGTVIVITIVAIFRSPIAPDRSVVTASFILVTQLIRWLLSALLWNRNSLRLGGDRCLSSVFGE
jgi:hypothetical protein